MDGRAIVFDMDGVIREWDASPVIAAEIEAGMPAGEIMRTAFLPELDHAVLTGQITADQWMQAVADRLLATYPRAQDAVDVWDKQYGALFPDALEAISLAKTAGKVCLLSNATDRLGYDMGLLGLDGVFDVVFNSARIGFVKPDPRIYAHVERALELPVEMITFFDDRGENVIAARERGWNAVQFVPGESLIRVVQSVL